MFALSARLMFSLSARRLHSIRPPVIITPFQTIRPPRIIPPPTASCPDVATFLDRLKRDLSKYATKFPTWNSLFEADGPAMKRMGIPVRDRRWLLLWQEKFRQGVEPYYVHPSRKHKRRRKTTRRAYF